MIRVFVSQEDAMKRFRCSADGGKPLSDLTPAESRVDQQPGIAGFQVGAVPSGAASQDRKSRWH
jgi:hypothetical protein